MKKAILALLGAGAVIGATVVPVAAITDGVPDSTNEYPFVGLMVAQTLDGQPLWRCTGTLISPTVFLTAGHCTEAPAARAEIWFDANVDATGSTGTNADGEVKAYPFVGDVGGTAVVYDDYDPTNFVLADLGAVTLDRPVVMPEYGQLPEQDQFDSLKVRRGQQDITFTAVGYGLQQSFPAPAAWNATNVRQRMIANPRLIQINGGIVGDFAMMLTNNAKTGGTCFGDSGGPNFVAGTNVIAGVTSFGLNQTCAGVGGVYRIDNAEPLEWIQGLLDDPSAG